MASDSKTILKLLIHIRNLILISFYIGYYVRRIIFITYFLEL